MAPAWHIYIIKTVDNTLYTGITTDVERRFKEHSGAGKKGARYLRGHRPKKIVFTKEIGSRSLASKVEYHVKNLTRAEKLKIIRSKKLCFDPTSGKMIEKNKILEGCRRTLKPS